MAIELIDADVDTAVIGDTGTGAWAVLFVADLAIDLAVSRRGYVVLSFIGSEEVSLLQEGLLSRGSCGIGLDGSGSLCLLKYGLLHGRLRDGSALF
jgi:hypothetical protein